MFPIIMRPSPRLRLKYQLNNGISYLLVALMVIPFLALIVRDEAPGMLVGVILTVTVLTLGLFALTWWLVDAYYRSIRYEIHEDEVIVAAGIWTHTVKHVPFRTVTNISVKRDIYDRYLFGMGTLEIQTAGGSGTTGAEETLPGLTDYAGLYEVVATALRRYRSSALAADQASSESTRLEGATLADLLAELRQIRQELAR